LIKVILILLIFGTAYATVVPDRDDKGRTVLRPGGVSSDSTTRVRFTGTHDFTIAGNQTAQSDYTIPQLQYEGQNVDTIISGVQFKTIGGCDGDKVTFQIVHPIAGVMDEFSTNYYVFKDQLNTIKEHRAAVPAGLYVRVVYTSTCANAARFIMNLFRYIETV